METSVRRNLLIMTLTTGKWRALGISFWLLWEGDKDIGTSWCTSLCRLLRVRQGHYGQSLSIGRSSDRQELPSLSDMGICNTQDLVGRRTMLWGIISVLLRRAAISEMQLRLHTLTHYNPEAWQTWSYRRSGRSLAWGSLKGRSYWGKTWWEGEWTFWWRRWQ